MTKRLVPVWLLAGALACACTAAQKDEPAPLQQDGLSVPSGQVMIQVAEEFAGEEVPAIDLSAFGPCTVTRTFPYAGKFEPRHRAAGLHRWYTLTFGEAGPQTKSALALNNIPGVEIVEAVPLVKPMAEEPPFNDPMLPRLWGLNNTGEREQANAGCDVRAFDAWTIETGKPEVIVAVIDSGVDYTHEDLAGNIWVNEAELNGTPGVDDDNNGYIDDINGYSFVTYDGKTSVGKIEPNDHGTHVAGTIGAVSNNGLGVAGVAGGNGSERSGIRIMPLQMMDSNNHGSFVAQAFVYAADNGAVLANNSWGNVNNEQPTSTALSQAIDYFNSYAGIDVETGEQTGPMAGGLAIFAAGNDGREIEHPAMDENVFAVAALSANYVRSYFTSYGDWVDISAPGGDANRNTYILSTLPGNQYGNMQGSSMACPHVTGVAALVVSHYGVGRKGFSRDKLIHLLQSTANPKALEENGSYASKLGAGLVDAYAALTAEEDQAPMPVKELNGTAAANAITLTWTVPGDSEGRTPYKFRLYYAKHAFTAPGDDVTEVEILTYGRTAGESMSYALYNLDFDSDYHFRIASESLTGLASALSDEVVVRTAHNTAPTITPLDGTSLKVRPFETGTLRFRLTDPDEGQQLEYSYTEFNALSGTLEGDVLTLSLNALKVAPGTSFAGTLSLTDSFVTVSQDFRFEVLSDNPPRVKGSFQDLLLNGTSDKASFLLSDYFDEPDGDVLAYTVETESTSIIVKCAVENGNLTVNANSFGLTTVTVTAKDSRGQAVSQSFRVLVRNGDEAWDVFPNPFKDILNIRLAESASAQVKVISSLGAVAYEGPLNVVSPLDAVQIDLSSLPAGVYTLVLEKSDETMKKTIVKQ
ncbi:MAG: S8 family serine peptidase [Bacteroidales bacterium]|nr:S8 family serine peptidase [Bacteroidales bacterium]